MTRAGVSLPLVGKKTYQYYFRHRLRGKNTTWMRVNMKRQMAKRLSGKKMSGKKDESDEFKENLSDEIDGGLERSQEIECELGSLSNVPELKQMACHNIETDTVSNNTQK